MKELTLPISKPMGVLWLIAAAVFIIYGILFYFNARHGWLIGLIAVILSQILIFYFWKDAKFGTIPNLIILFAAFLSLGSYLLHKEFSNRVNLDFESNNSLSAYTLSSSDIAHLPLPVQNIFTLQSH